MDDELILGAENMVEPEAEALPEAVEPPVVQATVTPLRSEPAPTAAPAPAAPVERDWIAQATPRPADPLVDADRPLTLFERMMNISRGAPKANEAGAAPAAPAPAPAAEPRSENIEIPRFFRRQVND